MPPHATNPERMLKFPCGFEMVGGVWGSQMLVVPIKNWLVMLGIGLTNQLVNVRLLYPEARVPLSTLKN